MKSYNANSWSDLLEALRQAVAPDKLSKFGGMMDSMTPAEFKKAQLTILSKLDAQFLKDARYHEDSSFEVADISNAVLEVINKVSKQQTLHDCVSIEQFHELRSTIMKTLNALWDYHSGHGESDTNGVPLSTNNSTGTGNNADQVAIKPAEEDLRRTCKECRESYTIAQFRKSSSNYFEPPYDYRTGCREYCLKCWLGVGPKDFPPAH